MLAPSTPAGLTGSSNYGNMNRSVMGMSLSSLLSVTSVLNSFGLSVSSFLFALFPTFSLAGLVSSIIDSLWTMRFLFGSSKTVRSL